MSMYKRYLYFRPDWSHTSPNKQGKTQAIRLPDTDNVIQEIEQNPHLSESAVNARAIEEARAKARKHT